MTPKIEGSYGKDGKRCGVLLLLLDEAELKLEAMRRLGRLASKVTPTSWDKILLRELIVVREMIRLSGVTHDAGCQCGFCQTLNILLDLFKIEPCNEQGATRVFFMR